MADERLLRGIIEIEVIGEDAPRRIQEIASRIKTEMQALGTIQGGSQLGKELAADLTQGEQATDRFIRALQELRAAEAAANGATSAGQARLRELDMLIAKTEQLQRLQRIPPGNPVAAAETRAAIQREDVRLRADAYGGGLAGMRASDRVNTAQRAVTGADAALSGAQEQLARAMQDRLAAETASRTTSRQLRDAEARLAEAIDRRDRYVQGLRDRGIRDGGPPAELELDVRKRQQEVDRQRGVTEELGRMQVAAEQRILTAKNQVAAAEARRAAAMGKVDLAAQDAERNVRQLSAEAAERRRVQGDPRREQLLREDGREFLSERGIDTNMSGRMQELAIEQQRLAAARESLIARAKTVGTEKDLATLMAQRETLERRILANTQAIERQRFTEGGRGGFTGGLFGNFSGSPEGVKGADIGFQAGQALKFYALYTGLSMVQQAISGLIRLSAEYTDAVSDLAIATNQSTEAAQESARAAAEVGAQYGTGPIEAMQGASKFARTFRDEQQRPLPGADVVGAQISSYINILEGPQRIERVMQDLISVMRAYGQGPEGAFSVYDQAQSISQLYGFQSGEVVGGAAALADLGKESGYSLPELVALIASVMQQTGTTSDAVAGDVKRILGSQDSPEMNRAFERFGVDLNLSFKDRLDALSRAIEKLPENERSKAITDLAADPRTGAVRAAILNAIPGARDAVANAGDSEGLVDRQVQQRLDNLSGAIKQFGANLTQTAVALGDMGITDLLTRLLQILNGVASGVTTLANVLGAMPDPVTEAAVAAAAFLLTMKAIAATRAAFVGNSVLSGIAADAGVGRGNRAAARTELNSLTAQRQAALAQGNFALTAALNGQIDAHNRANSAVGRLTTGVTGLARSAIGAAGPLAATAAIMAGLTVAGDAKNQLDGYDAAVASARAQNDILKAPIRSPEAYQNAIEQMQKDLEKLKKTDDGVAGWFLTGGAMRSLPIIGSYLEAFVPNAGEGLEAQAREIEERIRWAQEQKAAFDSRMAAANTPESSGSEYYGDSYRLATYRIEQIKQQGMGPAGATSRLNDLISGAELDTLFPKEEGKKGVEELMKVIVDRIQQGTDPLEQQGQFAALRNTVTQLRSRTTGSPEEAEAARQLIDQANRLYLDSLIANTEAKIANIKAVEGDTPRAKNLISNQIRMALNASTQAGDVGATIKLLDTVNQNFLESYRKGVLAQRQILLDQIDSIRKALAAARAAATLAREASGELTDHFTRMQDSNPDPAKLDEYVRRQEELKAIDRQLKTLDAAAGQSKFGDSAFDPAQGQNSGPSRQEIEMARIASTARPGDARSQATVNLRLARYQLANAKDQKEYYDALKAVKDAQYELSQVALEEAKARLNAGARPGDNFSQATTALKIAQLELKNARDKTQYYTALKSLRDAQYELAMLELERANNLRLLRGDVTDPVAQARAAVQEAAAKLRYDQQRGASSGVIVADQLALKQAQAAAASSAWDQQFGDMQTNYDLNRISLSAYLKYLQSQKTYLEAVKNKTRDQVEQLNQVDRALQGLAEGLQGQWNLGDIRMPTAYEMRRAMQGQTTANQTFIEINGADMGAVMQVLQQYVGAAVIQAAPTTPVKV